jgi:hypothetical protein
LADLFAILPFDHDTIQIASSLGLGVLVVGLTYVLASAVLDRQTGLVVTALAGPPRAGRLRTSRYVRGVVPHISAATVDTVPSHQVVKRDWVGIVLTLLSMSAGAVARPDGAHVFIPIFLTFVWRDRRLGLIKLVRTLPVLVIPVALPAISGMWTDAHGIQDTRRVCGRFRCRRSEDTDR